jgi:hypothetical protein
MFGYKWVKEKEWQDVLIRLHDLERHFVTARDAQGAPTQTLADVPVAERTKLHTSSMRGLSWPQRRAVLEATDGGRRA